MKVRFLILSAIACFGLAATSEAPAEAIAIIGTGDVGGALGPEFAALGHTVIYGSRDPSRDKVKQLVQATGGDAAAMTQAEAAAAANVVVLAVPGLLVEEITRNLGDLAGKIIIDPTNPLRSDGGRFEHAVASSNAEIIQAAAPGAKVVKAFSTVNWRTMVDPDSAGRRGRRRARKGLCCRAGFGHGARADRRRPPGKCALGRGDVDSLDQ